MAKLELMQDALAPIREWEKGGGGGEMSQGDIDKVVQSQLASRTNQYTPYGSVEYGTSSRTGKPTAYVNLSPAQQQLLDQQQQAQMLAGQQAIGQLGNLGQGRQAVEQAYFDRAAGLLNPEFARREGALRQRLANQGLPQSSGAFGREVGRFETGVNQQLEQAALAAVLAGGQEESRRAQLIGGLLGIGSPAQPQFINPAPITIPVGAGGAGGLGPAQGAMGGALTGAAAGAPLGPWGAAGGAVIGGLYGGLATR